MAACEEGWGGRRACPLAVAWTRKDGRLYWLVDAGKYFRIDEARIVVFVWKWFVCFNYRMRFLYVMRG